MESVVTTAAYHKQQHYYRYYRVNKGDTALQAFSSNDFRCRSFLKDGTEGCTLAEGWDRFDEYADIGQAMEKAKAGALAYIEKLIAEGEPSLPKLMQYRMDHYEDLCVNLVYSNIQVVEAAALRNIRFTWLPYHIRPSLVVG